MPKPSPRIAKLSLSANGWANSRSAYSLSSLTSVSANVSLLEPSFEPFRNASLVREAAATEVAAELEADVAVRREAGREAALHPLHVVRRLQALEADRRLELADRQLRGRVEARGDVGVLDHRAALAEVRHELEVVDAAERALDGRAHAGRLKAVDARRQGRSRRGSARRGAACRAASWFLPSADRRLKPFGPALTTAVDSLAAAAASSLISSLRSSTRIF